MILKAIHTEAGLGLVFVKLQTFRTVTEAGLGLACETTNLQNSVGLVIFNKAMCSPIKLKVNC